jgi:hypothetical protein
MMKIPVRRVAVGLALLCTLVLAGCTSGSVATNVSKGIGALAGGDTTASKPPAPAAKAPSLALPRDGLDPVTTRCVIKAPNIGPSGVVTQDGSTTAYLTMSYSPSCRTAWAVLSQIQTDPYLAMSLSIARMPAGSKDCQTPAKPRVVSSAVVVNAKGEVVLSSAMLGYVPGPGSLFLATVSDTVRDVTTTESMCVRVH